MDQQTDITHKTLYSILQGRPGIASMVKHASVGISLDSLPDSAFADDLGRKFPINTPANATMSLAYATKTANLEDRVSRRLGDAAEMYGILLPPERQVKVAAEVPRYLLPKQKKFGIKTASDVPKAEKALLRVSPKLSTEDLATASTVLVKAARDSGVEVSQKIMQWAGLVQCDTEKTANWIEAREVASDSKGAYSKLAAVVRHLDSSNTRDDLVKIAETIGKLDKVFDLQKQYGKKLPNPLETVFSTKTSMEKTLTLAGKDVPLADLLKKGLGFYEDVLGKDIAAELATNDKLDETKVVQELPILPADMLKPLLKKLGLKSSNQKKEAGMSDTATTDILLGGSGLAIAGSQAHQLTHGSLANAAAYQKAMQGAEGTLPTGMKSLGEAFNKAKGRGRLLGATGLLAGGYLLNNAFSGEEEETPWYSMKS